MYKFFKCVFDFLFAGLLLIVTFPFQIITLVVLASELKGNPIFLQKRGISINARYFTMFKFRTISASDSEKLRHSNSANVFEQDFSECRLTPFAKWLRHTGLDELPQIYNVLSGKMSFIGPRPFMIQDLEILEREHPLQNRLRDKIKSKPGITGLWQIAGEPRLGIDNLNELDLFYEENRSLLLELRILYFTILLILAGKRTDEVFSKSHWSSCYRD